MSELEDEATMKAADPGEDERRRHPRTPLSMVVQFRFNTFEDFLKEYAVNISPGGMFIRTDKPNEEGTTIYLQFALADGSRLIEGMGKVVRVNPPGIEGRTAGMGIEFENFDEESMALIHDICAARGAQNGPRN
jgi:molecular chaperone DnaK